MQLYIKETNNPNQKKKKKKWAEDLDIYPKKKRR